MGYKAVASAKRQMGQRSGVRSTAPSDSLFRQRSGTYPLNGAGLFVFQIWLSTGFWLSLAWVVPGHASLGGCWILAQIAPTPGHVTSQLRFSSPAEVLLVAGWARERSRRIKLLG